nr:hypothetical protein Itr_chr03CG14570 [Ipomoea trifida]
MRHQRNNLALQTSDCVVCYCPVASYSLSQTPGSRGKGGLGDHRDHGNRDGPGQFGDWHAFQSCCAMWLLGKKLDGCWGDVCVFGQCNHLLNMVFGL